MPKLVKIYVSRAGMSDRLRLRDEQSDPGDAELVTGVDPGDTVQWELDPRSLGPEPHPGYFPISSIVGIRRSTSADGKQYAHCVEVLEEDPLPGPHGVFIGTVRSPSVGQGKEEDYMISYTLPGETEVFKQDPKLQMNT